MNLYTRLRALLPLPPLQLARVLAVNTDGTCLVEYIVGPAASSYAPGLSTGATVLVRGTAAVDENVFIRNGLIESAVPAGEVYDLVVGEVAALPFGPAQLALVGSVPAQAGAVGGTFSLDLAAFVAGGYSPVVYSLAVGALPPGLALDGPSGRVSGVFSAAGSFAATVVATDSTHAPLEMGSISIVVAA